MRDKLVIWARLGIKRFQLLKPWAVLSRNSRLLAKLAPQYRDFPRHYDVSFNRDGIAFHSDLSDYLDWKFFFSPWNSERKRLFSMIKKGQKIIDVGAHHGATAITLAKLVGTNGFVHCFEPSTENKMRLDKNISSNKGLNIFSYGIAMGEKKMEVNMANPAPSNSSGNRIILENSGVKSGGAKMDILDHWINSNLSGVGIDWLKVTVNGFEHKVFSGAQEILKTQHPNLYFELSSENLSAQGNTAKEFLHYLESFGYEFQIASNATKISSDSANMDAMNADVIALWKGK